MFSGLLEAVDSHFPGNEARLSAEEHKAMLDDVLSLLHADAQPLIGAAEAVLGDAIFDSSEIGFEYSVNAPDTEGLLYPPIRFAEMFVRAKKDKRDISLNLAVARGYITPLQTLKPTVNLELEIEGLAAKVIFESLYTGYRAQVGRLLERVGIQFFTSYCSDIVGKSKSNKPSAKLDEYFTDTEADFSFALSLPCLSPTSHADGIRGFLALSLLYGACRSGLAGKGGRAWFEKHLGKLSD